MSSISFLQFAKFVFLLRKQIGSGKTPDPAVIKLISTFILWNVISKACNPQDMFLRNTVLNDQPWMIRSTCISTDDIEIIRDGVILAILHAMKDQARKSDDGHMQSLS